MLDQSYTYDRGLYYIIIGGILTVIALVVVVVRIYSRTFLTRSLGSDDFTILVSTVRHSIDLDDVQYANTGTEDLDPRRNNQRHALCSSGARSAHGATGRQTIFTNPKMVKNLQEVVPSVRADGCCSQAICRLGNCLCVLFIRPGFYYAFRASTTSSYQKLSAANNISYLLTKLRDHDSSHY